MIERSPFTTDTWSPHVSDLREASLVRIRLARITQAEADRQLEDLDNAIVGANAESMAALRAAATADTVHELDRERDAHAPSVFASGAPSPTMGPELPHIPGLQFSGSMRARWLPILIVGVSLAVALLLWRAGAR